MRQYCTNYISNIMRINANVLCCVCADRSHSSHTTCTWTAYGDITFSRLVNFTMDGLFHFQEFLQLWLSQNDGAGMLAQGLINMFDIFTSGNLNLKP